MERERESLTNAGMIHSECAEQRRVNWQLENQRTKITAGDFCKIAFKDGDKTEWMWVKVKDTLANHLFKGELSNEPMLVTNLKDEDEVYFEFKQIAEHIVEPFK